MSTKSEEFARKQKSARSKKALLLLLPVLIALVAFQGPRLMKRLGDAKEATEEKQGEVVQGFEELAPNGPPNTAPAAVPADPAAALAAAEGIADTDTPAQGAESDLVSFTRFEARDPFVQLVDDAEGDESSETSSPNEETSTSSSTSSTSSTATASSSSSGSSEPTTATGGDTSSDTGDVATQVTLTVNGDVIVVAVGDAFPAADPAFKIVAIETTVVKVGLASGSFSNGVQTLDLEVGESVTLISQPDGARFTIKVTSIG